MDWFRCTKPDEFIVIDDPYDGSLINLLFIYIKKRKKTLGKKLLTYCATLKIVATHSEGVQKLFN